MQTYQGVELEFIYEYNNGNIRKVVKAYRNGGRGSITGKRLQYGVNIRGITKLQEIADEKEENIIYDESISTVNGYRVQLTYDVDIALKSLDVHDMRIGDTYTVIDNEFRPAMQFNARIGKIEISFSDMTRNKCYLANFKKIKGAVSEDEENNPIKDIIKDTIEDYIEEDEEEDDDIGDGDTGGGGGISAHYYNDNLFKAPRMHSYEFLLYTNLDGDPLQSTNSRTTDYERLDSPINHGERPTSEDMYNFLINDTYVYDVSYSVLDNLEHPNIGGDPSNYCLRLAPNGGPSADRPFCLDHDEQDYMGECSMSLAGSRIFSDIINPETDRPDFGGPISADHHDRHMLDVGSLACGLVAAFQYHIKNHENSGGSGSGSDDGSDSGSDSGSDDGSGSGSGSGSGGDSIYATIEYADYIKDIANSAAAKATTATETAKSASNNVEAYSSLVNELKSTIKGWITNENEINGEKIHPNTIGKEALKHNILTGDHVQKNGSDLPNNQILVTNDLSDSVTDNISNKPASRAAVKKAYDKAVEAYNKAVGNSNNGDSGDSGSNDNCTVCSHMSYNKLANIRTEENMGLKYLEVLDKTLYVGSKWYDPERFDFTGEVGPDYTGYRSAFMCNGVADMTNIRCHYQIRTPVLKARHIILEDEEYYYDGDVGDPSITGHLADFTNITCEKINGHNVNDLFSSISQANTASIEEQQDTISELQATVQQQQETIATLEARLARLEQHLGLSDDI
jgi:hypothetical protein